MFAMAHAPPSLSEPPSYSLEPLDIVHATTCRSHKHEDRDSHAESGEISYFLVADGHGGAEVAERASSSLLDQIVSRLKDQPLEAAMREAFLSLHKEARQQHKFAGTTVTVVAINRRSRVITCANVGDSQGYLVTPEDMIALGVDHRLDGNADERQRVIEAGAKIGRAVHPSTGQPSGPLRAFPGGLAMGRSIGDLDCGQWVLAEPSCRQTKMPLEGGRVVVCSDGVWDAVHPEVVARIVRENASPSTAADKVVAAAIKARGLRDDTTCTVVSLGNAAIFGQGTSSPTSAKRNSSPMRKFGARMMMGKSQGSSGETGKGKDPTASDSTPSDDSGERISPSMQRAADSPENFSVKGGRLFAHFRKSPTGSPNQSREHTPDCTPPEGIAHLLAANQLAAGPTSVLRQGVKVEKPEQPEPPPPPR
eukprot:Transcript_85.p1 GENE.Transcript_85~~Transcript_85.p1  ORF type:complete len:422 (-),score=94.87 Transcript_85:312-1577(-)